MGQSENIIIDKVSNARNRYKGVISVLYEDIGFQILRLLLMDRRSGFKRCRKRNIIASGSLPHDVPGWTRRLTNSFENRCLPPWVFGVQLLTSSE